MAIDAKTLKLLCWPIVLAVFFTEQMSTSKVNCFLRQKTFILSALLSIAAFLLSAPGTSMEAFAGELSEFEAPLYFDMETESLLSDPVKDPLLVDLERLEGNGLWYEYKVSPDESLATVFINEGLAQSDLERLLDIAGNSPLFKESGRVDLIRYQLREDSRVSLLEVTLHSGERLRFERLFPGPYDDFTLREIKDRLALETIRVEGAITGSFYFSARAAGLSSSTIGQFANLFQWLIDFNRDLQPGDRFDLLLEKPAGERSSSDARILVARIHQKQRTLTGIRHTDGRYYTPKGTLLGRTFMRFPLNEKYSVSSGFNLARRHPITGKVRPHKGTDWSVPTGTPVMATAEGVVVRAVKNHPAAGNYIEIRNGRRYVTRFLHLSRLKVKAGEKVERGQVIALSGNSGLSTGPHLHYEVYVDGRPVDAMKAKPKVEKVLHGVELAHFTAASARLLARLEQENDETLLASQSGYRKGQPDS